MAISSRMCKASLINWSNTSTPPINCSKPSQKMGEVSPDCQTLLSAAWFASLLFHAHLGHSLPLHAALPHSPSPHCRTQSEFVIAM